MYLEAVTLPTTTSNTQHMKDCKCFTGALQHLWMWERDPLKFFDEGIKNRDIILSLCLPEFHLWSRHCSPLLLGTMRAKWSQPQLICLISLLICWGVRADPGRQIDPQFILRLFQLPRGASFSVSQNQCSSLLHEAETPRSILEHNDEV